MSSLVDKEEKTTSIVTGHLRRGRREREEGEEGGGRGRRGREGSASTTRAPHLLSTCLSFSHSSVLFCKAC